jgi:hypothetical protein
MQLLEALRDYLAVGSIIELRQYGGRQRLWGSLILYEFRHD